MNINEYLWAYVAAQLHAAENDKIAQRVRQIADTVTRVAQERVRLADLADAKREERRKRRASESD